MAINMGALGYSGRPLIYQENKMKKITISRGCWVDGKLAKVGDVLEVSDVVASTLIGAGSAKEGAEKPKAKVAKKVAKDVGE